MLTARARLPIILAHEVRKARKYRGLTQQGLAARTQLDLDTVAGLEAGRGTVNSFLTVLGVLEHRLDGQAPGTSMGAWIATRRKASGFSQARLADAVRLSKPTIIAVEHDRGHVESLSKILTALGMPVALTPVEHLIPHSTRRRPPRSPLRYPGGKSRALKGLEARLPDEIDEYREPFVGGGSVALLIADRFPEASIWINDAYRPLISFWQSIQDPVEAIKLVDLLRGLKRSHADPDSAGNLFRQLDRALMQPSLSRLDEAAYFFTLNRCSFSGLTQSGSFSPEASEVRWTMKGIDALANYSSRIAGWKITHGDYSSLLDSQWSGRSPFVFADPPYMLQHRGLYGWRAQAHTGFDHVALHSRLAKVSVNAMVTYNVTDAISEMYGDWQRSFMSQGYSMRSERSYIKAQRKRHEVVLRNYRLGT
ncbi:DNA adenine methylase [Alsobacter sp. SYSU BS001988]